MGAVLYKSAFGFADGQTEPDFYHHPGVLEISLKADQQGSPGDAFMTQFADALVNK